MTEPRRRDDSAREDHRRFEPAFVRALFDEMARSYERVNTITSFGFSRRWRRQAVQAMGTARGDAVLDAMTGMGEGWRYLVPAIGRVGQITAVDLSSGMLRGAETERRRRHLEDLVEIIEGDALQTGLPDDSVDRVLCLFGLKTLSPDQQAAFAAEIRRILRPTGTYSLIEVSVPPRALLRVPYLFYLTRVIPWIGRLLLGNPENYRMLGWYTLRFRDAHAMQATLERAGLEAAFVSYFFGCATGVVGRRSLGVSDAARFRRSGP